MNGGTSTTNKSEISLNFFPAISFLFPGEKPATVPIDRYTPCSRG